MYKIAKFTLFTLVLIMLCLPTIGLANDNRDNNVINTVNLTTADKAMLQAFCLTWGLKDPEITQVGENVTMTFGAQVVGVKKTTFDDSGMVSLIAEVKQLIINEAKAIIQEEANDIINEAKAQVATIVNNAHEEARSIIREANETKLEAAKIIDDAYVGAATITTEARVDAEKIAIDANIIVNISEGTKKNFSLSSASQWLLNQFQEEIGEPIFVDISESDDDNINAKLIAKNYCISMEHAIQTGDFALISQLVSKWRESKTQEEAKEKEEAEFLASREEKIKTILNIIGRGENRKTFKGYTPLLGLSYWRDEITVTMGNYQIVCMQDDGGTWLYKLHKDNEPIGSPQKNLMDAIAFIPPRT